MTRLREDDIDSIVEQLESYDRFFCGQTGYTMEALACKAVNLKPPIQKKKAAVVTVTSGLGVIGGFARSIEAILRHCGISAQAMDKTDVAGLQQAYAAQNQAVPVICDLQEQKAESLAEQVAGAKVTACSLKPGDYPYIIEASTAADVISLEDVTAQSIIAAPGVPCGVSDGARKIATVIHNPLELGALVMYFECIAKWERGIGGKEGEKE